MKKYQKGLIIAGVALDVVISMFLFVISIIIIVLVGKYGVREAPNHSSGLILYLLQNTTFYFWVFVFPLFLLLAANIVGLVIYVKKTSANEVKESKPQLDDLSEEQKEALKAELLKDLQKNIEEK